jgi:hypothetical protein
MAIVDMKIHYKIISLTTASPLIFAASQLNPGWSHKEETTLP